ncbi:MAG: beta-ketoacyl-[acyl-carrier-protein] synthase family protein [Fulvimarina manganoxydans]|uniref:beta-ketoacyl-[acyl-carrier-protein] synthase family protein n=1 Tax=Fulvimarina manganoxydans TaxID=937218 RepID=UPI002355CF38|nr:beta-ketoacyl-[acyl-carrier-protein] synthase family protein [Fulvimarina manganoxydans]MCK5932428.1 beta-ketoacyl-[acyl-carrier-protein] synthase family protein [Fulvimarina manganoxydans]
MRTVAVTGLGVIAPGGSSVEPFWDGLVAGRAVSAEASALPGSGLRVAEITDNAFLNALPVKAAALDRNAQLAVQAAGEALAMAGISAETGDPQRVAVVIGNGGAGLTTLDEQFKRLYGDQQTRLHPLAVSKSMSSSAASWVSIAYGLRGPTFVIASACASGSHAIGIAADLVRGGIADVAVAGGAEAPLGAGTIRAWQSMRILAPDLCRPFAKSRQGLLLAEGAGMLVLEAEDHAKARGAKQLAKVAGFSSSADARDMFDPSEDGMAFVMRDALARAGLSPTDIGYINAHGTGTQANDAVETRAVKRVFGNDSAPPMSSTKSVTGHGLGAAGGIEAVATVLAMTRGLLPPTANYDEADPECDLDYVPNVAREAKASAAVSNSFAFGGLNASLVFTA